MDRANNGLESQWHLERYDYDTTFPSYLSNSNLNLPQKACRGFMSLVFISLPETQLKGWCTFKLQYGNLTFTFYRWVC